MAMTKGEISLIKSSPLNGIGSPIRTSQGSMSTYVPGQGTTVEVRNQLVNVMISGY